MIMRFSTREEFVRFMYANKVEHGSVQSISDGFKEHYNDVQPFPGSSLHDAANLAIKIIINNDWTALVDADKSFFNKNGYIEVEYDESTTKVSLARRNRGRPSSNNCCTQNISLRLTSDKISSIDEYCTNNGFDNRSQFIKMAIDTLLNAPID